MKQNESEFSACSAVSALTVGACCPALLSVVFASITTIAAHGAPERAACSRCGWRPRETRVEKIVSTLGQLQAAVKHALPSTTITIAPGTYYLTEPIDLSVSGVVLRGAEGDRSRVTLRGEGPAENRVRVAISISARDVTIADLTVGYVGKHGVQVRGEAGASGASLHNVHVIDTGQQLVKGSLDITGSPHADNGLVACSLIEYTASAPSDYTNGVDVIGGKGWVVRDNEFRRIRGPEESGWRAGPTILFWGNSIDTIVERNVIVDSYRGIAFGLGPGATEYYRDRQSQVDHQGGVIRDNILCNANGWADEGIEVNAAREVRVEHNTLFLTGTLPWSIGVRFPVSSATLADNITNRRIVLRDGGHADERNNVTGAPLPAVMPSVCVASR
jgi:hypothetical protein